MYYHFVLLSLSHLTINFFFFFNDPATTEIYTFSLHDALPISREHCDAAAQVIGPQSLFPREDLAAGQDHCENRRAGSIEFHRRGPAVVRFENRKLRQDGVRL